MRDARVVVVVTAFFVLIGASLGFSQDAAAVSGSAQEAPGAEMDSPEGQWLLGEVVSVDAQRNEVLVKYLDYETEQEKQIVIMAGDTTAYENVKSLIELKPKDTVSIDYTVSSDGKNIAKTIGVEVAQEEAMPPSEGDAVLPLPVPMGSDVPAVTQ